MCFYSEITRVWVQKLLWILKSEITKWDDTYVTANYLLNAATTSLNENQNNKYLKVSEQIWHLVMLNSGKLGLSFTFTLSAVVYT